MKAVKCPVCNGKGIIGEGTHKEKTCNGCSGKGWITINDFYPYPYIDPEPYEPMPWPYRINYWW